MLAHTPTLTVARTVAELRAAVDIAHAAGLSVGFVPTMGALHEGHATLVRAAADENGAVVVSVFVNPTQFNDASDLENYPRTEAADFDRAAAAGATIAFAPSCDEVYPAGFGTTINAGPVAELLEGAHRPATSTAWSRSSPASSASSRGCRLLRPQGCQQLAVIQQVVRDLVLPTQIVGVDTVREPDGLAMSSRNMRLTSDDRVRALALSRGLAAAQRLAAGGERSARALEAAVHTKLDAQSLGTDYATLVDAATFRPVDALDRECILAVAAQVGAVRLIDNVRLEPATGVPLISHQDAVDPGRGAPTN